MTITGSEQDGDACPFCGAVASREPYDIGDGPELSCSTCEMCWGADGQPLTMGPIDKMRAAALKFHETGR